MDPQITSQPFEAFGPSHLLMLAVFAAGIVPAIQLGRRHRNTERGATISRGFAVAIVLFTVPMQVIDFLPGNFDIDTTLPLQLCDLAWLAAVVALWTRRPTPVALTYYWGLVLTTQGLVTPWLSRDFPDPKFIGFWGMHLLIVWAATYLTWGLGLHPTWRGFRSTVTITATWLVAAYLFNLVAGTNYGFVNDKPGSASLLDYLGPWPIYLGAEVAIVAAVWALLTWPWVASDRPLRWEAWRTTPRRTPSTTATPSPRSASAPIHSRVRTAPPRS